MADNIASIKGRVLEYIEYQGITKEDFYKKIGMKGQSWRGKGAESELKAEKIAKVLLIFPEINPYWLILGEGEREKDWRVDSNIVSEPSPSYQTTNQQIIELYQRIDELHERIHLLEQENKELRAKLPDAGSSQAV